VVDSSNGIRTSRAVAAASTGALVSSATPILLVGEWTGGAGFLLLAYGLGVTFWIAFCLSLIATGQWTALRAPTARPVAAALIVSLVYPLQWGVVSAVLKGDVAIIATSVVGAASVCVGVALVSRAWHWPALLAMLAWSVVSAWGDWRAIVRGLGWPHPNTFLEWFWFIVRWQVPEAALAAVWLVRARRCRLPAGLR
jgi:hypothetical protein